MEIIILIMDLRKNQNKRVLDIKSIKSNLENKYCINKNENLDINSLNNRFKKEV